MKDRTILILALSSLFAASAALAAAQANTPMSPPKVLLIDREYLKPGKSGSQHVITESAFVKAAREAKATHYIAMDSLSGPNRTLFVFPYDSFADYGKDIETQAANASSSAALDAASIADGALLSKFEAHLYAYQPDMSLHTGADISHARYWQYQSFKIKPGHDMDWQALVKIYTDGFANIPAANWATYESQFAEDNGGVFVVITPMKTLAEVDQSMTDGMKFWTGLSAANQKRVEDLAAACVESSQKNVFQVNPSESYPYDEWVTGAPEIWGHH